MNPDVLAPYTQNIAQGKKNDSRINAVYNANTSGFILGMFIFYSSQRIF